ncbi:MAG: O-antigen ligase family protein [Chloroflexota bacterium]
MYPAAILLALVLPFGAIQPLLTTPWLSMTDDKLVLLLTALTWLLQGRRALPTAAEWRALVPSLGVLVVAVAAALQAPVFVEEALKSVWRLGVAAFALLLVLRVGRQPGHLYGLLWALVIGAGASACLGLGEAWGWPIFGPALALFKVAPTRVGADLRVSATFQYATIASMYFEMLTPVALVLAATARRRWQQLLGLAIAGVCTASVVLSLTRAGLVTLALVFAALLAYAGLRSGRRLLAPTLAACGVLVGGVAILAVRDPVFDMRLVSESDADWYAAAYSAPATLRFDPDPSVRIALDVRNDGRIVWSSSAESLHPFALGYRWLTADGTGVLDLPPGEVPLPHDIRPGETIHLEALVGASHLPPGTYRLAWGMLQRDVVQFYERGSHDAESVVTLGQAATRGDVPLPAISPRDDGEAPWVVGRLQLWGAALRLAESRPLFGVGPDNFRHLYGAELGLETWDERVQANNVYLELLADTGVLGLAAFGWLILPPIVEALRVLRARMPTPTSYWLLGCGLGVLAFLVHGVLDSFLAFTPTALLFWMLLAMILNLCPMASAGSTQKPHVSGR